MQVPYSTRLSPNPALTPVLPELLFHIEEQCTDRSTLANWSLVSSSWQRAAQRYLLSCITVFTAVPSRSLSAFTVFLRTHPHLRSAIHTVVVKSRGTEHTQLTSSGTVKVRELREVISMLHGLRSLSILAVNVLPESFPVRGPLPLEEGAAGVDLTASPVTTLRALRLWQVAIHRVGGRRTSLLGLLGLFSSIDTLSIDGVWFSHTYTPLERDSFLFAPPSINVPRVRVLEFRATASEFACNLMLCIAADELASLRLKNAGSYCAPGHHTEYQACIDAAAKLKQIELQLPPGTLIILYIRTQVIDECTA